MSEKNDADMILKVEKVSVILEMLRKTFRYMYPELHNLAFFRSNRYYFALVSNSGKIYNRNTFQICSHVIWVFLRWCLFTIDIWPVAFSNIATKPLINCYLYVQYCVLYFIFFAILHFCCFLKQIVACQGELSHAPSIQGELYRTYR